MCNDGAGLGCNQGYRNRFQIAAFGIRATHVETLPRRSKFVF